MKAPPIRTLPMALLLLAGLALARSSAGQPLACTANASVPPAVNVERITAPVADLVVICTGGTPTLSSGMLAAMALVLFGSGWLLLRR